ncbi:MAG TPA: ABC transporter permease [Actinomycetota bacterium]
MRFAVPLARRNILADRRRLAISTLGVGLAVALILLLAGLWGGVLSGVSAYADRVGADLFVRQPGTMILTEGAVPLAAADAIRTIPGVEGADPVIARYVILDLHGTKEAVSVIGYRPGAMGGPWMLAAGRAVRTGGEIVMDENLGASHGIGLGDTLGLQGERFRVVGLSSGTATFAAGGFLFVSLEEAERLFGESRTATSLLVRASRPASVAEAIRRRTGLAVDPATAVAAGQREVYAGSLGRIVDLMILIAFAAGTLVVALTVYSAIADRLREYGIAKAIGARRRRLFRIVLGQTVVVSAVGTLVGFALYAVSSRVLVALRPQFPSSLSLEAAGGVVLSAGAMALLAAIVPTRRVARLDPASVYRG